MLQVLEQLFEGMLFLESNCNPRRIMRRKMKRKSPPGTLVLWSLFLLGAGLVSCQGGEEERSVSQEQNLPQVHEEITLLDYDTTGKSPDEIALWVWDTYRCNTCHGFTADGLMGLTPQGQQMGRDFQGCPSMMATVWETVAVNRSEWTEAQKQVRANFSQFGCTVCHQVDPTGVTLTDIGSKASQMHLSCPEVMGTLAQ